MSDDDLTFRQWVRRTFFDTWYMPLAIVAMMASLALVSSVYFYVHIQDLREDRVQDQAEAALRNCGAANAAARQNESQDRTLLRLVVAATSPDEDRFPIVATEERDKLNARVDNGRQIHILPIDFLKPVDCYELPSQRPFRR